MLSILLTELENTIASKQRIENVQQQNLRAYFEHFVMTFKF